MRSPIISARVRQPETPKCLGEKQAPSRTPSNHYKSTHGEPKDPFYIYVWDHFGFHFLSLFVTISATTCFSKIRTAPTREHDFRGCSLPKNINFGTLFRIIFRTFCRPPSGTPFSKPRIVCCFGPQQLDFGTPFGSHWPPKRLPQRSRITTKTCNVSLGVLKPSGDPLWDPCGIHLGPFWHPFGIHLVPILGSVRDHSQTTK